MPKRVNRTNKALATPPLGNTKNKQFFRLTKLEKNVCEKCGEFTFTQFFRGRRCFNFLEKGLWIFKISLSKALTCREKNLPLHLEKAGRNKNEIYPFTQMLCGGGFLRERAAPGFSLINKDTMLCIFFYNAREDFYDSSERVAGN
jgi:hypothetical protein